MIANEIKRLGILVFFDRNGIVDDYLPCLLDDICKDLSELIVVCNGSITDEGKEKLEPYADRIFVRENEGYDFGAWKEALTKYIGWEHLAQFDELLLFNDSFCGPIHPFSEIFDTMSRSDVEFWGLSYDDNDWERPGQIHYFLQSFFLLFKAGVHKSQIFRDYWEQLCPSTREMALQFEASITEYFENAGFTWGIPFSKPNNTGLRHFDYWHNPWWLLQNGYPIIKFSPIISSFKGGFEWNQGEQLRLCLRYIREKTDYDERLLLQHILRLGNIADIHDNLSLNYVIQDKFLESKMKEEISQKALVICYISCSQRLADKIQYFEALPTGMDILVVTRAENIEDVEQLLAPLFGSRLRVFTAEDCENSTSALLITAKPFIFAYEFACVCHDVTDGLFPISFSKERLIWENLLSSEIYINNILNRFQLEPCLGILSPFPPMELNCGGFWNSHHWYCYFKNVRTTADKIGLKVNLAADKKPLTTDTAFWFRTTALKGIFDYPWSYEELGTDSMDAVVNRCYAFAAQQEGFYSGYVATPEYAAIITNGLLYRSLTS